MKKEITTDERGKLIGAIISTLRFTAYEQKKFFDEGTTFFQLAFKDDDELRHIARLCHI